MKRILIGISLIVVLFSLTGCTKNSTSIDKFYYVIGLGIDETDQGLLKISLQIAHTISSDKSSSSSQSTSSKIYTVEGETINSCFAILNNYLSKQLNFSHCSALVLSEKIATQNIEEIFSTLGNNTEIRGTCDVLVSSGSAYDVLDKVSNSGEGFSSRLFDYLINSSEYTGFSLSSNTFSEIYKSIKDEYSQVSTVNTIIDKGNIQIIGATVFKDNKMVGKIGILDTLSHLLVTNKLNKCTLTFDSPFRSDEKVDMEITKLYKKSSINVSLVNNSPFIEIDIYPKCYIRSSGKKYDYTTTKNIEKLENATNAYLENIVKNYLYVITKKYNSDIVGFGKKLSSKYLTLDEFDKIHWNDIFSNSFYKVNVHTKITSSKLFNKQ